MFDPAPRAADRPDQRQLYSDDAQTEPRIAIIAVNCL